MIEAESIRQRPFIEPGWYRDLSNEDYHGSFGTSSSQLKKLIEKTPAHMLHGNLNPKESTESMKVGTLVHTLVLEPEKFDDEYFVMPKLDMRKKSDKEMALVYEEKSQGKTLINESQLNQARSMAVSVKSHPVAAVLLEDIIVESSIYWWYKSMEEGDDIKYKEMLKVRPDAISRSHSVLIDLKTTTDASYSGFIKSIQNFYYHVSAVMYLEGVNQCKPLLEELGHYAYTKFIFICVENVEPYLASVYELSPEYMDIGKHIYRRCLKQLRKAKDDDYPGFPDDIRVIEPPTWASRLFTV